MKRAFVFAAFLGLLSTQGQAAPQAGAPAGLTDGSYQVAGLAWRCGKNNPAEWGTFGNGCLKQKRAAGKNGSASAGNGGFSVEQPTPPPPPRPLKLKN